MSKSIPTEVREEVIRIVESYNEREKTNFQIIFKGKFAYLSKIEDRTDLSNVFMKMLADKMGLSLKIPKNTPMQETKLGRLEYCGKMDNWEFAVFKYSREIYDPNEPWFPGSSKLNGTIEGALHAGKEIYP